VQKVGRPVEWIDDPAVPRSDPGSAPLFEQHCKPGRAFLEFGLMMRSA
jgi:hypothetical protein